MIMAAADLLGRDPRRRPRRGRGRARRRPVPLHGVREDRGGGDGRRPRRQRLRARRARGRGGRRAHRPRGRKAEGGGDGPVRRRPPACGCAVAAPGPLTPRFGAVPRSATSGRCSRGIRGWTASSPRRTSPARTPSASFRHSRDQPVLADGLVRMRGDPVAALLGTREAVENFPDSDLPIAWDVRPALSGVAAALAEGAPAIHAAMPDNVLTRGFLERGDVAEGHALGAATASGAFETCFVEHAYIEPEAGFARRVGDRVEVFACTQAPAMDQEEVARVLGVPLASVRIVPTACGGGFGGKLDVSIQPILAVAAWLDAAARADGPVARGEHGVLDQAPPGLHPRPHVGGRGGPLHRLRDPTPTSTPAPTPPGGRRWRAASRSTPPAPTRCRTSGTAAAPSTPTTPPRAPSAASACRRRRSRARRWWTTSRRRSGSTAGPSGAATRSARATRRPPARSCAPPPDCPNASTRCATTSSASSPRPKPATRRSPRVKRGVGIACMWYGCGNTALPNPSRMRIALTAAGELTFFNGAVDIGQGSTTVLLQIAADALGLPPDRFRSVVGDTDLTYDAGKTSASRQTFVSGNAARLAGEDLRRRILARANAGPDARLSLEGALLRVEDGPASRTLDLATMVARRDRRRAGRRGPLRSADHHAGREGPGRALRDLRLRRPGGRGRGGHRARHRRGAGASWRRTTSAAR